MTTTVSWFLVAAEVAALCAVTPRLLRAARGGRPLTVHASVCNDDDRMKGSSTGQPSISVVVPARNEAGRISGCLTALRGAPGVVEVIVVDDESTDDTAVIARTYGATVVVGAPLPAGWVGKIWALRQGIDAACGDVIVTLDADTRPDPGLPMAAARALSAGGVILATVAPRFDTPSNAGTWLHAAMLTSLVYRHGAGAGFATADSVANGQCMVFRRADAVSGGWCDEVRGSTVEDVALVRMLVRRGSAVAMFDGASLLTVRMFEDFGDTWRGWGRSLALNGADSRLRQVVDLATTAVAQVAPPFLIVIGLATPMTIVLLAIRLGTLFGTVRVYERRGIGYWLSPLADLLAWLAVARGASSHSHHWRDRTYR